MRAIGKALGIIGLAAASLSCLGVTARVVGQALVVNEVPVATIRQGDAATRFQRAIAMLRAHDGAPSASAKKLKRRTAQLMLGDKVLLVISEADAKANQTTALALAGSWARNLNKALQLPPLKVSAGAVRLGPGQAAKIWLTGSQAHGATISASPAGIVRVSRQTGLLNLAAHAPGETKLTISGKSSTHVIQVTVVPSAASFPQQVSAEVTGLPATGATVRGAVESAIWRQLKTAEDAELKLTIPNVEPIPIGEARTIPVQVRASSARAATSEGMALVTVRNVPIMVDPESELWYCNEPENITRFERLFSAPLKVTDPARMLFHHINEMGRGLIFHTQIINTSSKSARVLLIPGDSPTDRNPVLAGIDAAEPFLANWIHSSGEVVTIPPGMSIPLAFRRLGPKETVSGLVYLKLLSGGPESVLVRADAKATFQAEGRYAMALSNHAPWRILGARQPSDYELEAPAPSEHVYPQPFRTVDVAYQVGGRHGFVRIGQQPIKRADGNKHLDGNFGVVYTINARIDNPTEFGADLEVVFEASAGYSGALFAMNGQVMRTPLLQPKDERRIFKMRVEPGQSRQFTLQTIPLSGGSYPATLAIRPIDSNLRSVLERLFQ